MMALVHLPHDLLQQILCFVETEDKFECISCCRDWYFSLMKTIRYIRFKKGSHLVTNLSQLISSPLHQLSVETGEILLDKVVSWLSSVNYSLNKLICSGFDLVKILQHTESLHVKSLTIRSDLDEDSNEDEEEDSDNQASAQVTFTGLSKVLDCESLSLELLGSSSSDRNVSNTNTIPYLASVKQLKIQNGDLAMNLPLLQQYLRTLHSLILYRCDVADVSMLGHIPHLELSFCDNIVDISALNHNDSVKVDGCYRITDYTSSFAFSRKIDVFINGRSGHFNLERWTKVEELQLRIILNNLVFIDGDCSLPLTVKKCHLFDRFISAINFTVTSHHSLHELALSYDNTRSLTSLEDYGLERVAIIKLQSLWSLQSLEGLGRGRNRQVIINSCDMLTDFSPLNHVPMVEITKCTGFTNPLQLRDVHSLSILPLTSISFTPEPCANIHSLTILYSIQNLTMFDGLERIPYLYLGQDGLLVFTSYLEKGREVYNQRIEFTVFDVSRKNEFLSTHDRFLHKDYDYFVKFPKRWIWSRKEISK